MNIGCVLSGLKQKIITNLYFESVQLSLFEYYLVRYLDGNNTKEVVISKMLDHFKNGDLISSYKGTKVTSDEKLRGIISLAYLDALEKLDSTAALSIATKASTQKIKKRLNTSVTAILAKYGDESIFDFIAKQFISLNDQSAEKFYMTVAFGQLLHKVNNPIQFKKGIDLIVKFRESIPKEYRSQSDPYFNTKVLAEILKAKKAKGQQDLVDIVIAVIPKMKSYQPPEAPPPLSTTPTVGLF